MMAALACVGSVMTSCEDTPDKPIAQEPTNPNFLNTPATANFTYDLNSTETVTLTCSQPDFGGVATPTTYAVQLSLSPTFDGCPAAAQWNNAASTPQPFIELPSTTNNTTIAIPARDVADAINACRGFNDLKQLTADQGYTDYNGAVYMRLRAFFNDADADQMDRYTIVSNVIKLSSVVAYPTLRQPGFIYLIGKPGGWTGPEAGNAAALEKWKIFEPDDKIGSQIYIGTFDIAAGEFQFRFYSALEGWDFNSIGAQDPDNTVSIAMKNGVYSGPCFFGPNKGEGKGAWMIDNWAGGRVTITVNLKAKTVEFKQVN